MKYVVAIIQPDKLDTVLDELLKREINLVTVTSVMGRGRQKGVSEVYRSHKEAGSLLRKIKLAIGSNPRLTPSRLRRRICRIDLSGHIKR